jgi:hypothetical protein
MTNPWFRVHNDILDDDKMIMLDPADKWYFISVLAMKNLGLLDSEPDPDRRDKKVSIRIRLTIEETQSLKIRLMAENLIDDDWQPLAWANRQYLSDNSTERSRKHRAKKRQADQLATQVTNEANCEGREVAKCNIDATLLQRCRDVSATPPDIQNTDNRKTHGVCGYFEKDKTHKSAQSKSVNSHKPNLKDQRWQLPEWVERKLWDQWAEVVGAGDWHAAQLKQALTALDRVVNQLGWPQALVFERSIARGYKSFFPLNAKGQPEKNPNKGRDQIASTAVQPARTELEIAIDNARLDVKHWERLHSAGSCSPDVTKLLTKARDRLGSLEEKRRA